jgi:hypothetical protein
LKQKNILEGAEPFWDPKKDLKDDKNSAVSPDTAKFSDCGNYWAYSTNTAGSDW